MKNGSSDTTTTLFTKPTAEKSHGLGKRAQQIRKKVYAPNGRGAIRSPIGAGFTIPTHLSSNTVPAWHK
jgi:hypothetical protein